MRLEWSRKSALFPPHGYLACGVRTSERHHKLPFTKEARPGYPRNSPGWPAYKDVVEPPADKFWEGDNLKEYRNHLVVTIIKAWKDLAPLMDVAVSQPSN